ncbi:hypothetical protein V1509DRAFT_555949, partial [Lipomyces kononenkoae]
LFKVMHRVDNVGFWLLSRIPAIGAQSFHISRKLITDCTGLNPVKYDCCHQRPCVCYFGEYEGYQGCPKCGAARLQSLSKRPNKTFTYIPLTPRIQAIFRDKNLSQIVEEYPSEISKYNDGTVADFWNGEIVRRLRADGFLKHATEIAL